MYEYTDILPGKVTDFGTFRVVAQVDIYNNIEPDYCGSDGFSETLLGWDGRHTGWGLSWNTCKGHGVCGDSHPIDPDIIRYAANELDDSDLERWLNICAPTSGIEYRVSRVHGYSQGDVWLLVESYPAHCDPNTLPDPEHNEAVNWARGDVHSLVVQEQDEDDEDTWHDVHNGYIVYGPSWDLPKMDHVKYSAEECRDEYLHSLERAKRKQDARDTDLTSGMI